MRIKIILLLIFSAFIMAGCSSNDEPEENATLVLYLNFDDNSPGDWPPTNGQLNLLRYDIELISISGEKLNVSFRSSGSDPVTLTATVPVGTYNIAVEAYLGDEKCAQGSANGVTARLGGRSIVPITMYRAGTYVLLADAEKPVIVAQPQNANFTFGGIPTALTVSVKPLTDGGNLTYQWYKNSTDSNSGGTKIDGATNYAYIPPTDITGIIYYYVVVTNTNNNVTGKKIEETVSETAKVTVNALDMITFDGNGATSGTVPAALPVSSSSVTLPNQGDLSKTGYNFDGWNTLANGTGTNYSAGASYTPAGNITLYAKWTPKTVAITLNSNGGVDGSVTSISGKVYDGTVGSDLSNSVYIPTYIGHIFIGWSTNSGTTNTENFYSSTVINTTNGVTNAGTSPALTLYAVWVFEIESTTGIGMMWIPAGTFTMGQTGVATPEHQVTLTQGFYMGKYQVTQDEYFAVMKTNPSYSSSSPAAGEDQGKRPVEQVSWYDALVFCNRLSDAEGLTRAYRINGSTDPDDWGAVPTSSDATWNAVQIESGSTGYRLPTEAQWEYACRAGKINEYYNPEWDGVTVTTAPGWYSGNSGSRTHQVGLKDANDWGLYDMHGNVYEWCWDLYGIYLSTAQTDPTGAVSGSDRVLRGGNYYITASYMRSAYRYNLYPYGGSHSIGLRVVRP